MKRNDWRILEYIFGKPWLASILIGSSIHLFFYIEELLTLNRSYLSDMRDYWVQYPVHAAGRIAIPFLIPLIVTSVSRRMVIQKERKSLFKFPRANPEIVLKLDESGRIIYMNPTAEEYLSRLGLDWSTARMMLPDGYENELAGLISTGKVYTAIKKTGDVILRYVFHAFEDEKTILVSGCDITEQMSMTEFISDAVPLMYRVSRDGTVRFIGGAFKRILKGDGFRNIRDALLNLGIPGETTEEFHESLFIKGRDDSTSFKSTRNVELKIRGENRWHAWVGTVSSDGENIQGQLFDIHDQYLKDREFDKLRMMTYGTPYLGERTAMGLENARDRDLSVMFIDIVDSTKLISAMTPDGAKEYVEMFSRVVTSAVKNHSGYVDKFMGDGAMVVFGLQLNEETDVARHPVQSVNAARDIIAEFKKHNESATADRHIHVRIGIESGVVRAGVFQNDDRMIFTSIGIPVVIAARLEKKADKDRILITHAHHERLPMDLPIEILCGSHQLKGITNDVIACTI
jgi:class 3 adenylate cyclase